MQAAARRSYRWVKEWVPQDLVVAGGPCALYKWVREDRLSALKPKDKEQGAEAAKAEPTTEVLFLCSYDGCGKTFVDAGALRKHANIHGERQYICHYDGCGKKFLDSSKLKRHFLIHTGEKNFVCPHEGCGKVVKRQAICDIGDDDEVTFWGRKRSVRERLGSTVVDSDLYDSQRINKRQQTESNSSQHGDDDRQVGRDDLRLKLMRKGLSQRSNGGAEQNGVDLREKLSQNSKNLPRYDARGHVPESRSRYDAREKVPDSRSRYGLRGRVPESRASTHVSRMPSARSADDLFKLESSRKPYSSWTADGVSHWSPDKLTGVQRDVSPQRTYDQMRYPSLRSVGTKRTSSLVTRDVPGTLRTQPYAGKSTISIDMVQPANGVMPSGTVLPTAPVMTEVPLTVTELLNSLGLEKYVVLFQAEEVDMAALRQMKDSDLKEIGVPMGPRKKILLAVAPCSKQRQR